MRSQLTRLAYVIVVTALLCACPDGQGGGVDLPTTDAGADAQIPLPPVDAAVDAGALDASPTDASPTDAAPDAHPVDAGLAQLVVTREGDGDGVITSTLLGIDCGTACTATVAMGTQVVLSVTPGAGSEVAGWSGPCAAAGNAAQCSFVLDQDRAVAVSFMRTRVAVDVKVFGPGGGRVKDDQGLLDCVGSCTGSYLPGTPVTLTAEVNAGPFQGWTGDCTAAGSTCSLIADAARAVRAVFGHFAVVTALPFGSDAPNEAIRELLVGPDGDLYVVGYHSGPGQIGALALAWAGETDIFVARIDGTTGQPKWARTFGGIGYDWGAGLALRGEHVYVAAAFEESVDFGGGAVTTSDTALAILALSLDGEVEWTQTIRAAPAQGRLYANAIDVTADGQLIAGGNFYGTVDFGPGAGVATNSEGFLDSNGWLLALDGDDGTSRWLRTVATAGRSSVENVDVTNAGDVIIGGEFRATMDLGGGPIEVASPGQPIDLFVARLRGVDGAHTWSRGLGGPGWDSLTDSAIDGEGNVYVGGHIEERIDFGGGWVIESDPLAADATFVARLDGASGATDWAFEVTSNAHVHVQGDALLVSGGFHSLRLELRDRLSGAVLRQRTETLNGNLHSYRAILAGDHAWGVLDVFGSLSLDGLQGPTSGATSWIVRIGL